MLAHAGMRMAATVSEPNAPAASSARARATNPAASSGMADPFMRTAMTGPVPNLTSAQVNDTGLAPLTRRASFSRAASALVSANSSSSHDASASRHRASTSAPAVTASSPTSNRRTFARCDPLSARTTSVGATAPKRRASWSPPSR